MLASLALAPSAVVFVVCAVVCAVASAAAFAAGSGAATPEDPLRVETFPARTCTPTTLAPTKLVQELRWLATVLLQQRHTAPPQVPHTGLATMLSPASRLWFAT